MAGKVGTGGVTFKTPWDNYPGGTPCAGPFLTNAPFVFPRR